MRRWRQPCLIPMARPEVFQACLEVIEAEGWKNFSFEKAATLSGIPLSVFQEDFTAPLDVITALFRQIDQEVLETFLPSPDLSPRECLFDVIMTRFDAAQPYKLVLQRFWEDWPHLIPDTPALACQGLTSMGWMLEAAGLSQQGLPGMLRMQGLTVLYFLTLKTWLADDSLDLGKTMAFLDKGLSHLEKLAPYLNTL